jgi:carboxymethylenebutenolidase
VPDITFSAAAGPLRGYLAVPDGQGPWPGVVVVHDVLGMTADLRRITDRFAASGFLAIAPALYRRGMKVRCVVSTVWAHFAGRGTAFDDLVAAREYLAADPRCTGRVGLAGFCMGAGFCIQLAPSGKFDVTAPNYGMMPKDVAALKDACPVVASFGAKDRVVPTGAAARLEHVLADGAVPHDVKLYPDVGHSFMNDWGMPGPVRVVERIAGMAYSAPEAEDAWRRIVAFFGEHLS